MYIIIEVVIAFNEITISMIVLARPATLYLLIYLSDTVSILDLVHFSFSNSSIIHKKIQRKLMFNECLEIR